MVLAVAALSAQSDKGQVFRRHLSRLVADSEPENSSIVAVVPFELAARIQAALCLGWFDSNRGLQESVELVAVAEFVDMRAGTVLGCYVVELLEVAIIAHDEHDYHPAKCQ